MAESIIDNGLLESIRDEKTLEKEPLTKKDETLNKSQGSFSKMLEDESSELPDKIEGAFLPIEEAKLLRLQLARSLTLLGKTKKNYILREELEEELTNVIKIIHDSVRQLDYATLPVTVNKKTREVSAEEKERQIQHISASGVKNTNGITRDTAVSVYDVHGRLITNSPPVEPDPRSPAYHMDRIYRNGDPPAFKETESTEELDKKKENAILKKIRKMLS